MLTDVAGSIVSVIIWFNRRSWDTEISELHRCSLLFGLDWIENAGDIM